VVVVGMGQKWGKREKERQKCTVITQTAVKQQSFA
jgi:hypothetical protein